MGDNDRSGHGNIAVQNCKKPAIFARLPPRRIRGRMAGKSPGNREIGNNPGMNQKQYKHLVRLLESLTDGADTLRAVFAKAPIVILEPDTVPGRNGKPDHLVFFHRNIAAKEARQHPAFKMRRDLLNDAERMVNDASAIMEECVDEFVSEDRGGNAVIAKRERELYPVLLRFLDATATPIQGAAGLYDENKVINISSRRPILRRGLRPQCREWADMLTTWFPDLNTDMAPADTGIQAAARPEVPGEVPGNPAFVKPLLRSDAYRTAINDGRITPPRTWNGTIKDLAIWLFDSGLLSNPRPDNLTDKITRWQLADGTFLKDGNPVTARQLKDGFSHG